MSFKKLILGQFRVVPTNDAVQFRIWVSKPDPWRVKGVWGGGSGSLVESFGWVRNSVWNSETVSLQTAMNGRDQECLEKPEDHVTCSTDNRMTCMVSELGMD